MMNKILLFLAIGFATGMLSCSQQTLEKTDSLPQTYTIIRKTKNSSFKNEKSKKEVDVTITVSNKDIV